jgi:hypothetical protein
MGEWQPIPSIDGPFYSEKNIDEVRMLLNSSSTDLIRKIEGKFKMTSHSESIDDFANWIEMHVRKSIRSWSGGDTSEFTSSNIYLKSIKGRVGYHLCDLNRVVCNNSEVRIYLENTVELSPVEQVLRINILLLFNNDIKKLHFGNRGAPLEIAALMCKIGLEKFLIC